MSVSHNKTRIVFIDLIRAFAVLQMVQGHTINVLLDASSRSESYPIFALWQFMRGMTAPIFLFTAGTVFTYLFILNDKHFFENPRFLKGIKRALLLIFLGYILRYPTWTIFDFSQVTGEAWRIFFSVDVLQLIGAGLLLLLIFLFLSQKFVRNDYAVFSFSAFSIFLIAPSAYSIEWGAFLPEPIAAYISPSAVGSLFPVFPWMGYIVSGAILGSYLARHPMVFKSSNFSLMLATIGCAFIFSSMFGDLISKWLGIPVLSTTESTGLSFFRLGFVLVLNSIVSFIAAKVDSIPKFIILVGRNTLLIYVVHLIILYGSAWNPGLNKYFAESFNGYVAATFALLMIGLMTLMVLLINLAKIKSKPLVA